MADLVKAAKEAGLKPEPKKRQRKPLPDPVELDLTGAAASVWELEIRAHREMLRSVIEDHREGYGTYTVEPEDPDELVLEEEVTYPPIAALRAPVPPPLLALAHTAAAAPSLAPWRRRAPLASWSPS